MRASEHSDTTGPAATAKGRAAGELCGKWMPKAMVPCAMPPGHGGQCRSAESLVLCRQRKTERRWGMRMREDPQDRERWNRASRFRRLGITEAEFNQILEDQGYACAMCFRLFDAGERVCADHDHTCCPNQVKATAKTCGKCIRGLLCFRCNTSLGYVEKFRTLADAYLDRVAAAKAA